MTVYETILKRRTIRKFEQKPITDETLEKLINAARVAPSAANKQPLKYLVTNKPDKVSIIFECVHWAGYLMGKGTPGPEHRPTAFIVVLADTQISKSGYEADMGLAVENILLAALEDGIGGCLFGAIDRDKLRNALQIPSRYEIALVIALGFPAEQPVLEEVKDGDIKYYKDENGVLHVPKRSLNEIMFRDYIPLD